MKEQLIRTTDRSVLLATDLHAGNVLRARRKPWLVIDIKPYLGDRTFDLTQHLLNCLGRVATDPVNTIRRIAVLGKVDNSRLKDWLFARLAATQDADKQVLASRLQHISL